MTLRSTTAVEVPTHLLGHFKQLVNKFAPQEHRDVAVKYVSVVRGDRHDGATSVSVLIDVDADEWASDEVRDAAQETVAHALVTLKVRNRRMATTVKHVD